VFGAAYRNFIHRFNLIDLAFEKPLVKTVAPSSVLEGLFFSAAWAEPRVWEFGAPAVHAELLS
jgi:hypothetical protein